MLFNARHMPAAGLEAGCRPLFPGLLASLLFLTQHNLQRSLAILVWMVGVFCYLSARQVFNSWGTLPAALYILLLYFYIQPLISTTLSELPGLAFGCLGFILLWRAARALNVRDLVLGLVMLMLGISIRAGAFFIFPMLICWAGWVFRGETRFSYRVSAIALITVLGAFLVFNILYPRLVVEAGSATFGNLAYAFYGQVLGGAGWHRAITDRETRDALVVYQAAFDFFLNHPLSLFIGIAKSYRDFFVPNSTGIFSFVSLEGMTGQDILFWILGLGLLIGGIVRSCRVIGSALPALLFAAFLGVFLSIPFLPPVDGGHRFYAGTMPFFFALLAYAVDGVLKNSKMSVKADLPGTPLQVVSVLVFVLVVALPVLIQRLSIPVAVAVSACTAGQFPFAIKANPGSYVDLIPDNSTISCGLAPEICLRDFKANGAEKTVDDFYQELAAQAEAAKSVTRVEPAIDLIGGGFHFFMGTPSQLWPVSSDRNVIGCALEIRTSKQSIYKVETITMP